jgi:ATP-dependent DNA helicase RecQ
MKEGSGFERLSKLSLFTKKIVSMIFDEAHCISAWGSFCSEYKEVGHLRFMLPKDIPIMITSATLPPLVFDNIKHILQLHTDNLLVFCQSTDRPNIHIVVHTIINSLGGFADFTTT